MTVPLTGRDVVDDFTGDWAFLSNFADSKLAVEGLIYPTAEHAFNALKTLDETERARVRAAPTPGHAKRRGRRVQLRAGWNDTVRYEAMRTVVEAKFTGNVMARTLLASTGHALLVEGNTWHDQHWGDCRCEGHAMWPGSNHLGRMLMGLRARVCKGYEEPVWARAMVTGHRPQHLPGNVRDWVQGELDRLAVKLRDDHGTVVGISGGALGSDTWWARSVRRADLDLWLYLPFECQPDPWRPEDQDTWRKMRTVAAREVVLAEEYDVRLLLARNDLMVRDADVVVAVWDQTKTTGGTASAVASARNAGRTVIVVDPVLRRTHLERPQPERKP